jgi:hypothetical protein
MGDLVVNEMLTGSWDKGNRTQTEIKRNTHFCAKRYAGFHRLSKSYLKQTFLDPEGGHGQVFT